MAKRKINIGLIGYRFMGKVHSLGYKECVLAFTDVKAEPIMKEICGRNVEDVKPFAEQYGWERAAGGYLKTVEADDIDLIDISTSNNTHKEIAIAAADHGKHIFCEKPMALSVAECKQMINAVEKAGVVHMVNFNYRRVPAVELAKRMVDE